VRLAADPPCAHVQAKGARTVAVTCSTKNQMARAAHAAVHLPLERELCPFDLAPVTSTAVQMLFGDTLAVAVMQARGVSRQAYGMNHPAGALPSPTGSVSAAPNVCQNCLAIMQRTGAVTVEAARTLHWISRLARAQAPLPSAARAGATSRPARAGRIGKRLMLTVRAVMLSGAEMPIVTDRPVLSALPTLTAKACGCLLVVADDDTGELLGVFTDGDLRRAVQADGGDGLQQPVSKFMTAHFKSVQPDTMAIDALQARAVPARLRPSMLSCRACASACACRSSLSNCHDLKRQCDAAVACALRPHQASAVLTRRGCGAGDGGERPQGRTAAGRRGRRARGPRHAAQSRVCRPLSAAATHTYSVRAPLPLRGALVAGARGSGRLLQAVCLLVSLVTCCHLSTCSCDCLPEPGVVYTWRYCT
jgi:CBS domain-containing protein